MTRIVLSPTDLAHTASLLDDAAGEHQLIGARVASCDCGCMPGDVAGTVDAVAAQIRGELNSLSSELVHDATELAWRAGVDQSGGFSAVGAAWGDGVISVGGSIPDEFAGLSQAGNTVTVGSAIDVFSLGGQQIVTVDGGGDVWGGLGTTAGAVSVGGAAEDIWGGIGGARQTASVSAGDGDIFGFGNRQTISVGGGGDIFDLGGDTPTRITVVDAGDYDLGGRSVVFRQYV